MGFEVDNSGRSFYQPNVFYINFNPSYLDSDGIPKQEAIPVFFHEYAHLIQDTTTIFGINSFMSFHDVIQDVFRITHLNKKIKIPVSDKCGWMSFIDKYNKLIYPTDAWPSQTTWAFESYYIDEVTIKCNTDEYDIPIIKAHFIDNTEKHLPITHGIGVREIKEAYSMAVQNLHSEIEYDYYQLGEFQYAAIERILLKTFGSIDSKGIITICHWSLNSLHPAIEFFEILEDIKNECIDLTWNDLYIFLRDRFYKKHHYIVNTIQQNYSKLLQNQALAGGDDLLYKAYKWYSENVLKNLDIIFDENSLFPIDTVLCDPQKNINNFMENHPIWLYESGCMKGYTNANKEQKSDFVYFFRSIANIVYNLNKENTKWSCILIEVCNIKNEYCSTEPWKRWSANPKCNYCAACYYLNLTENTILLS